jgi:2-polyprenyl-3-methyl-5-hydroxy-6-metoxy-1,4-benzoquinol methylase
MSTKPDPGFSGRAHQCHVCDWLSLDPVPEYEKFSRVTSDSKPWPKGGRLSVCRVCGCVQKTADAEWQSEVAKIYDSYSIYHQSEGVEQSVFEQASGRVSSRSAHLLEHLRSQVRLPETGKLLDVGCGNGALLRAFSSTIPRWSLSGTELNAKYRKEVESIDRVEALHVCSPDRVPGSFDLITLIHVLEHIPKPRELLAGLWNKLEPGGLLVIQVPAYMQNPFDLLIADHITHFSTTTILDAVQAVGYEIVTVTDEWVPKELTVVARKGHARVSGKGSASESSLQPLLIRLQWLDAVIAVTRKLSASAPLGLFGTSIAATWLFEELAGRVSFFVDEDIARAGRTYMGRSVYFPSDVPSRSQVFIPLPPGFAEPLKARLEKSSSDYNLVLPPTFLDQAWQASPSLT